MTITKSTLTRGTAVAAVLAGFAYIIIQFIHPADILASLSTRRWVLVHTLSFAEAVLALIGITGIYLRQIRQFGIIGLVGYLMFGFFLILQASFTFAEAFIAPLFIADAPQVSVDVIGLFGRYAAHTDLGPLSILPEIGGLLYVVGALLFGIAVIRARALSRGAGILLVMAAALTPVAGALLPHTLERLAAIPMGLALIWLGYSLWSDQHTNTVALQIHADETPNDCAVA
ncbi:hypothetical protein [Arthrobacter sp. SX1312]|uniref:hypothetical protein n=1 Tax=Arthrobacter sp. SX1312 TaxID=2058896 RepID=UPI000CE324FE|nr:hypothetical protein [Arthrobacter sp. SX1312]